MSGSLLDVLAARKAELQAEQVVDIPVPLWTSPVLRLRIKPVDHPVLKGIMARAEKARGKAAGEADLNAHAAIVVSACVAVLIGDGDDESEFPLTSPMLVEALQLPEGSTGVTVVRGMVLRDGDVVALSNAVFRHSGYAGEALEEFLAGE